MSQYRDAHRDPALEAEQQGHKPSPGHLCMPDGSVVSSGDGAFLTAAAPYVYAAHLRALGERGPA